MAAINELTCEKIKGYLESFIDRVIENNQRRRIRSFDNPASYLAQVTTKPQLKPFHAAIMPPQVMAISEFERSFSTTLGTTFEEAARLIALDHHAEVQRSYEIWGEASHQAL
ncbi:MAG: TdeIII family type II restriction endonuclease, partial [Anaerolineae bacterium]|nr:TdeIII family type II restriction endonuclease [Anaerolineae bacterium]